MIEPLVAPQLVETRRDRVVISIRVPVGTDHIALVDDVMQKHPPTICHVAHDENAAPGAERAPNKVKGVRPALRVVRRITN